MKSTGVPEEIIREIGGCGRYQIILGFVMHAMKTAVVWSMFTMIFAAATPKWWCYDDVIPAFNNSWYQNSTNTSHAEPLYKSCTNRYGDECKNIVYDYSMTTLHNDLKLACTGEWIPSTIASIQMAGLFLGHFVSGHLADTFGRKVPMMLALFMMLVFNVVAYFSTSWILIGVARALLGCGMSFYLTIQYTLVSEVSLIRWRALNVNIPSWPIEGCLFALLAYIVPNWRNLSLISGITAVPFMASWCFVPESFRWYLSHDRLSDARKSIERVSNYNGKLPPSDLVLKTHLVKDTSPEQGDNKHYSILDLFRHKSLLKITCICVFDWFSLGLTAYGITFGLQALSGNFFVNMFTFNAIIIIPALLVIYLSNRFGRRKTCIFIFTLKALASLTVGIVQFLDIDEGLRGRLTTGFALVCAMSNGMGWGGVQTMTLELYPTVVRNIGYGFLNMCARAGAVLGPQFAYLDTQIGGFMYFFISAVATLCATGTFFLHETSHVDLTDRI